MVQSHNKEAAVERKLLPSFCCLLKDHKDVTSKDGGPKEVTAKPLESAIKLTTEKVAANCQVGEDVMDRHG